MAAQTHEKICMAGTLKAPEPILPKYLREWNELQAAGKPRTKTGAVDRIRKCNAFQYMLSVMVTRFFLRLISLDCFITFRNLKRAAQRGFHDSTHDSTNGDLKLESDQISSVHLTQRHV